MSPIDGVLFDLDDTLIDWWGSVSAALAEVADDDVATALLAHCQQVYWERRPGTEHVWHRNTWALHTHRHDGWPAALPHLDPDDLALLLRRFDEALWVGFFPDTVPTLDLLADGRCGDLRLGVLSNNRHLPDEVQRLRLHDWFEVAVAAPAEIAKPAAAAFELGCSSLGTSPARTVYVGDSIRADVLGARDAGLIPVWIDRWGDPWPDRPADVHRVTALAELPQLLDALATGVG